jgi:DNA end-binding protein Ku
MRAIWKGTVSFGLVSIPVSLYAATASKDIAFHQVHVADNGRIHNKRICSVDGSEVPYTEIAKGYETPGGELVVLTDDDLASLPVPSARSIEVQEFLPLESIDPIYFDRSYYLEPQQSAVKPYHLLRDALAKYGHVAIGKIALRQRETLAVLRVYADVIVLETMLWPDEVRKPAFPFLGEPPPQVRSEELAMAGSLIDAMSDQTFDPAKYKDEYQQALEALIEAKLAGRQIAQAPAEPAGGPAPDLTSALSASVEAARKDQRRMRKSQPGLGLPGGTGCCATCGAGTPGTPDQSRAGPAVPGRAHRAELHVSARIAARTDPVRSHHRPAGEQANPGAAHPAPHRCGLRQRGPGGA